MQLVIENAEQLEEVRLHTGLLADEDFGALCERYADYRVELWADGTAFLMPPTGMDSGRRNSRITRLLDEWAERDGRGACFDSSTYFHLPNGSRLSPDAAWIWEERLPLDLGSSGQICPDFVIELRSKSDALGRMKNKMHEWIENGAQLGWLIDPQQKMVTVFRPGREPEELVRPEFVVGESPVEGFRLELAKIWA